MSYRVTIEHQPSHGRYGILGPFGDTLAERLAGRLGTAARAVSAAIEGGQQPPVVVEYNLGGEGRFASHEQVVDFVAAVMQEAGLYAVRAVVSEVVRHYVTGAIASGATALLCTKDANPWVMFLATAVATGAGALAGGRVEQEVARYEACRQATGGWGWYQVAPTPRARWSWETP